ncbi:hypothetical protein DCO56_20515 [Sphingobacterium athyrii]|uniref:Uncharacterized protein n=2 Tax=Sphingobacterium athyrii TaxID=2152717 RepID=A0A363NP87_9SPHI|nr:hypothetical protein DCO56_20515 [Sphingobacterium athyrii]
MGKGLFAQKFYPRNFIHLYTDEGIPENKVAKLNAAYLLPTGFQRVNDSLYIHPQTKERLSLSTRQQDNKNELLLTYITAADLSVFRARLLDYEPKLEQIDANTYQATFNNPVVKYMIAGDTVIDNKRLHAIKFLLIYDKGQKFPFSSDNYTFPVTETYPLQHTTWYFTAKYERSPSNSEYNEMRIIFGKEKTAYKIEFVDDINFKLTYTDPKKKTHVYQGQYQNYKSDISFFNRQGGWSDKDKTGRALATPGEQYMGKESFYEDPKKFAEEAGTARYFRFIFLNNYQAIYHSDSGLMELSKQEAREQEDILSMPRRER